MTYLLVAFCTHALLGAVLVTVWTGRRPAVGAVAGLAADADFLFPETWGFPFVHRGLTHSPVVLAVVLLVGAALDADEDLLAAVGVGYLSHLLFDSLTPKGVLWLYPVSSAGIGVDLAGHSLPVTVAVWTTCGVVLGYGRGLPGRFLDRLLELLAEEDEQPDTQ